MSNVIPLILSDGRPKFESFPIGKATLKFSLEPYEESPEMCRIDYHFQCEIEHIGNFEVSSFLILSTSVPFSNHDIWERSKGWINCCLNDTWNQTVFNMVSFLKNIDNTMDKLDLALEGENSSITDACNVYDELNDSLTNIHKVQRIWISE